MNKKQRKKLNKQAQRSLRLTHILIAAVAIIECLILIAFTTYSWIESASSLVIMNGPQSTTTTDNVNIDISNALNYDVNLDSSADNAELITFFSQTKYYRYGRASSSDGKTFYFPKKNNTNSVATAFRKGDTTDYNTSYAYFDFNIKNSVGNKDFFFNDDTPEKLDIFQVIDPSGYFDDKYYSITENGVTQTPLKTEAIRRAMRISVVATNTSGDTFEGIYSPTGKAWTAQSGTASNSTTNATAHKISDYGLNSQSVNRDKLFTSKKNKDTRVQIRIWFEMNDKDFVTAFGNGTTADITTDDFKAIAGVKIAIYLSLGNADNNFRPFYFDDYTFSNTSGNDGGNLTLDNSNYKVWFHCSNPDNPSSFTDYLLTREETSGGRTRWSADNISQTVTDYLCDTISDANLKSCYFGYGPTVGNPTYTWYLNETPTSGTAEFIYNAYSRYKVSNDYFGSGCWNDRSTVRLIQFKDYATMLVPEAFNRSSSNFRVINQNPVQHLFVNNYSTYHSTDSVKNTAAMYYDSTNEIFKSYVPQSWMSSNVYFRFNLGTEGYYGVDLGFIGSQPQLSNGTDYIYTALGQDENRTLAYYNDNGSNTGTSTNRICDGFGTWGGIEQIHLNAELIDYDIKATDRFKVSVAGTDLDSSANESYPLIPDATGMIYSAYIPAGSGVNTSPFLKFVRTQYASANTFTTVNARWLTSGRGTSNTYYPVKVDSSSMGSDLTRGYWDLSVLVDGTYENLIYDTLTDGDGQGRLEYSFDGSTYVTLAEDSSTAGSPTTDDNRIGAYRWYVPCSAGETVYYRWTPYYGDNGVFGGNDDTTFVFAHNTASGLYCVITEPENAVTIAQNTPSEQRRNLSLATTGFDVSIEQSLSEQNDLAETGVFPPLISDVFVPDLLAAENGDSAVLSSDENQTPDAEDPTDYDYQTPDEQTEYYLTE